MDNLDLFPTGFRLGYGDSWSRLLISSGPEMGEEGSKYIFVLLDSFQYHQLRYPSGLVGTRSMDCALVVHLPSEWLVPVGIDRERLTIVTCDVGQRLTFPSLHEIARWGHLLLQYLKIPSFTSLRWALILHLEAVKVWVGKNRIWFSLDKTELLWWLPPSPNIGNVSTVGLEYGFSNSFKTCVQLGGPLGLLLLNLLAFIQEHLVLQMRPVLDQGPLQIVTHSRVTSKLDYCNVLYMRLPWRTSESCSQFKIQQCKQ